MAKTVVIMQGIPGSGKSHLSRKLKEGAQGTFESVSADDEFVQNSEYVYDAERLEAAHLKCFIKYMSALASDVETIVVDNVNSQVQWVTPYALTAAAFGYKVRIARTHCSVETAFARGLHNVSMAKLLKFEEQLKNFTFLKSWEVVTFRTELGEAW
jgi:predicted ABC-type ATPase